MASAYSREQTTRFLSLIKLPSDYFPERYARCDLALLTTLHTHMLSTVPYENLSLHYSQERSVSLDPQRIYEKIVIDGRGRGGYCMENSLFYMHILRALGFIAYTAGVRIRLRVDGVPQGDYGGWRHIVNIVTLDDGFKWMIDVGFGGDGATRPVPLIAGQISRNIGTQDIRLIHDHIPQQVDRSPDKKLWIYQYRNGPEKEWNSFYAFPELEFLPEDFAIMNWFTGSSPQSFQTFTMLVVLFLRRKKENGSGVEEVYGKRMLVDGVVKENLGGKTRIVKECETEDERIGALRTWFGITLTAEEKEGIRGHSTELLQ